MDSPRIGKRSPDDGGEGTDLEALSPADLWTLEERATEIQDACRELNDERLRHWVEVEGKTQREIAEMVGRSKSLIAKRCARLNLAPLDNRGGNRVLPTGGQNDPDPTDAPEEVDAEIVEETVTDPKPFDLTKERNRAAEQRRTKGSVLNGVSCVCPSPLPSGATAGI